MRDLKSSSAKTSAVRSFVAVLEKETSHINNNENPRNFGEQTRNRETGTTSLLDSKNSEQHQQTHCLENNIETSIIADENFQTAVEDFNSVAEDVQRNFEKINTGTFRRKLDVATTTPSSQSGFKIERTHSLKTIRTNPYFTQTNNTRSLGRNKGKLDLNPAEFHLHMPKPEQPITTNTNKNTVELNLETQSGIKNDEHQTSYHLKHENYKRLSGEIENSISSDSLTNSNSSGSSSSGHSDNSESDSDTEQEHNIVVKGLETIAEEERIASPQSVRSKDFEGNETISSSSSSSCTDEPITTREKNSEWSEGSGSEISSTNSIEGSSKNPKDSSTRCNSDFQWISKEPGKMDELKQVSTNHKPPINLRNVRGEKITRRDKNTAPGSLDRRRPHHQPQNRHDRDQKSKSTHILKTPPPRLEDFQPCQNWCCNDPFFDFHRRHERNDPKKYGSSPILMETCNNNHKGSYPDIYGADNHNRTNCRREILGCCSYHMAPPSPYCYYYGENSPNRGYHWTPPPFPKPTATEQDEKIRKLQFEKENLQLQVQVLTDQIEAQSYKISDLEKSLGDKKHSLVESEEKLQREMLSRSSLETQKLELMSIISDLKLQQAATERENMELRNSHHFNNNGDVKKTILRGSPQPQTHISSTPIQHNSNHILGMRVSPSPSPVTTTHLPLTRRSDSNYTLQDSTKSSPGYCKRQIDIHYASLPRQQFLSGSGSGGAVLSSVDLNANPSSTEGTKKTVAFAQTEKHEENNGGAAQIVQFKNRGIKKIFGKIKRSNSGNLEDLPGAGEFQRGGVRATATARLGWSEPHLTQKPDKPFAEWDTEVICDWLQDLGLDQYIPEAKKWVKNGQQLQECGISEIEKELNIKNPLHKKKLQLALIDVEENGSSDPYLKKAGELDTAWVLRWLDDVGLPQHKESFLINRVDGRVLHRLTVDDLGVLHVTSLLHVASIKRGIKVLRENEYNPACLKRRSVPDEEPPTPKQVSQWTTHRVMEWLKAVDLAEYAPNLRGAGIHGGLMVYETKFTAELLASLLSIPPGKTLLRRHLNTHFKELLGRDIIQEKREAESTLGYIPLTPTAKLKITKKSQFSLKRKKSKGEADYGDLVCPLNPEKQSDDEEKPKGRGCLSSSR